MITIDRDTVITLLFACEQAMDSMQREDGPISDEDKALREKCLEDVETAHSLLSEAFCGVPSRQDNFYTRH